MIQGFGWVVRSVVQGVISASIVILGSVSCAKSWREVEIGRGSPKYEHRCHNDADAIGDVNDG